MTERPYLSIGEVLGLLLEEFSDVTISKIRFLESQGLIEPERTASGYRKFYDADVERLRVILREQRQNFLPLRVIRDRLESGAIESDPSDPVVIPGGTTPERDDDGLQRDEQPTGARAAAAEAPRGIRNVPAPAVAVAQPAPTSTPISTSNHPAASHRGPDPVPGATNGDGVRAARPPRSTGPSLSRRDLCAQAGLTEAELAELETYGVIAGKGGAATRYAPTDLAIAQAAAGFLKHGIDARHLRAWRTSAEREAGLFEQRILPLMRQRNPRARQEAAETLGELSRLGEGLRAALVADALRAHLDG